MLTKDEANKLHKIFSCYSVIIGLPPEIDYLQKMISDIKRTIDELTEKPKREIQVGDIYLSNNGAICEIEEVYDETVGVKHCGGTYLKSGKKGDRYTFHLDLSKRYKLVEVDDE